MGFTLWIVPSASDAKLIETIMHLKPKDSNALSSASYAKFHPHITLAAQLPTTFENDPDVLRSLIPQQDTPLTCSFASIDVGDAYFRSVYIAIKPTDQLLDLHKTMHEKLQIDPETPIFPHLSLVYITGEDAEKGERMKYYEMLEKDGKFTEREGTGGEKGVSLNYGFGLEADSFDATEVWAVKCDGPVETWKVKAKYPLVRITS